MAFKRAPAKSGQGAPRQVAPKASPPLQRHVAVWDVNQWLEAIRPLLATTGMAGLSEGQVGQLAAYMQMLQKWNSTYNLTALREPQDMLSHHLADCLAVLGPLQAHLTQAGLTGQSAQGLPIRLLDVGSGGGLPGVVLAIARPDVQVTCVDTVGKKAAFIRQVGAELKLANLRSEHARVELLIGQFDVITSRAFASLPDFVGLTNKLLAPEGVWMAMKGKMPDDEVGALSGGVSVFHVEQLQVPNLDAQRCVVWLRSNQA